LTNWNRGAFEKTLVGVVQRWAQQEPAGAAAWVVTFEEGELRASALHEVVKLWADRNLTEAGEWLKSLGPGSVRSLAIAGWGTARWAGPARVQRAEHSYVRMVLLKCRGCVRLLRGCLQRLRPLDADGAGAARRAPP
jgi:hypothetical protein